jgi:hypothetical protein
MYVLATYMILQGNAAYMGTSKNTFYFKLLKNIRLHPLTSLMRLNGMNLLKCFLERGRNERK